MAESDSSVCGENRGDEEPLSQGLRCAIWQTHLWRQWRRCSMNVSLLQEEELHVTKKTPVMKILVSGVVFVTIMEIVVMDVVVVGVLVMRTGVPEMILLMVAVFALMMKLNHMAAMKRNLIMMLKIPLHMVDGLTGVLIVNVLLLKIGDIIVVIFIMMTRIILLGSS
jgi:hypothetical protein